MARPPGRSHRNLEEPPENALKAALVDALAQWIQEPWGWGAAALGLEGFWWQENGRTHGRSRIFTEIPSFDYLI